MSVTVLGGAGFVGLNLVEALLARGEAVRVLDRGPVPEAARAAFAALPGRLDAVAGDVTDPAALAAAIPPGTRALVCGAAITADAGRDARDPETILAVNLAALVPTLRAARAAGVGRVVILSSTAALGEAAYGTEACDEERPADPTTLYAITKFAGERVGARLGALWGLDVRAVRLSSVYGPWEYATGLRDTLSPHFQVMLAAHEARPALLARPCRRDWIYAPDVAGAVLALLDAPAPAHPLYNVAPGETSTLLAWGERLAALRPGFVCRLARDGEAPTIELHAERDRAPLDARRLAGEFGWRPAHPAAGTAAHLDAWWRRHADGLVAR